LIVLLEISQAVGFSVQISGLVFSKDQAAQGDSISPAVTREL
jgi:hypothetical protein